MQPLSDILCCGKYSDFVLLMFLPEPKSRTAIDQTVKLRRTVSTCIVSTLKTKENKNWSSQKWPQNLKPSTPNSSLPRPASSALPERTLGRPALWTRVSRLDGDLAGRSCAGSFLEASPQLCVQCKVGLPARNHSTIRATFMWDKSIICLWNFC